MMSRKAGALGWRATAGSFAARWAGALGVALIVLAPRAIAQSGTGTEGMTGRELYVAACANCHAGDGRGAPISQVGFDVPLPDFTDCNYATRENAQDWFAVVHQGGPVRGFSQRMPSFGKALTADQIERVVAYVRSICDDGAWPRGELNLPRAQITEKAFPEDEGVYTTSMSGNQGSRSFTFTYVHEKRFGARDQLEVKVPITMRERGAQGRGWTGGHFGDVTVALKHVFAHTRSLDYGSILSGGAEISLPTGDARGGSGNGIGSGTPVAEPFVLAAQMLGGNAFLQFHGGLEFPVDRRKAGNEQFSRAALGKSFVPSAFGRTITPIVEFDWRRTPNFQRTSQGPGSPQELWSWVPQLQFSVNRRQHIQASVGVSLPMNNRSQRSAEVLVYLLWDWFDGGFIDGW